MRISDWSSDVCSSDLIPSISPASAADIRFDRLPASSAFSPSLAIIGRWFGASPPVTAIWIAIELKLANPQSAKVAIATAAIDMRSEEHTSELQSLMRTSYAAFCLKKKKTHNEK